MFSHNIKCISYNCRSFRSNLRIISNFLIQCDILFLQETIVSDHASIPNFPDFLYLLVPSKRSENSFYGRSSGGLLIFYRKKLANLVEEFKFSERIAGIYLSFSDRKYLFLNVYFPCDYRNDESMLEYISTLSDLTNIFEGENCDELIIAGDLNCDPFQGRFYTKLKSVLDEYSLNLVDLISLPADSYTYISSNSICSTSWLDHVISTSNEIVQDIKILYGVVFDDHLPLEFFISVPEFLVNPSVSTENSFIGWSSTSDEMLSFYCENLEIISEKYLNCEFRCSKTFCSSSTHRSKLDEIYEFLTNSILDASSFLLKTKTKTRQQVTGWNEHCRESHALAREKFLEWNADGRIRNGVLFEEMKTTRSDFKYSLRHCRKNEMQIKKQKLCNAYKSSNSGKFWKEVKTLVSRKTSNVFCIDGANDRNSIVQNFSSQYFSIFNDPQCRSELTSDPGIAEHSNDFSNILFSTQNINEAINKLNDGIGWDGIHARHLKLAGEKFRRCLASIFSEFLKHGYLPLNMLRGEITPILKSGILNKSKSQNYRPIMNSSALLKTFEYCISFMLPRFTNLNQRQFGFRPHTGTLAAVSLLKEVVNYYNSRNSNVHCAMIDLSKAFDKINHDIMLKRLNESSLPKQLVLIIDFMLRNTYVKIKFNDCLSDSWRMANGTRQGGILSPYLFNLYIDYAIRNIHSLTTGCKLGLIPVNIICYADDILLMAPSANGLQFLIDKLVEVISGIRLQINPNKSQYMVFKHKPRKLIESTVRIGDCDLERKSSCKYLGVILMDTGHIKEDVDRCCSAFFSQFNGLYQRFNFVDFDTLLHLFLTYCSSFYGIELWCEYIEKPSFYNRISVAYHKAIKKLCRMHIWESNHDACERAGLAIFKHLLAIRSLNFFKNIIFSRSECMKDFTHFFSFYSNFRKCISGTFSKIYSLGNILKEQKCIVKARVNFVQRNEPRSNYVPANRV